MNFGKKLEKIRKGLGYTVDFNDDEIEYFTLALDLFNTTDKEKCGYIALQSLIRMAPELKRKYNRKDFTLKRKF